MFRKLSLLLAVSVLVTACDTADTVVADVNGSNRQYCGTQDCLCGVDVGDRVFFDVDKSGLKPDAQATLDRQAKWLKKYASVHVVVQGYCDERGTREYNPALGKRRAVAVTNYLIAAGVSSDRIKTISYGKERPAVLGSNEAAWAQNRRTVTLVPAVR